MIVTEDEAKTRWCPFTRAAVPAGVVNRVSRAMWRLLKPGTRDHEYYTEIEEDCHCIASGCMAWRFSDKDVLGKSGYCGLAGEP